jgi:hypothetical protein
MSDPCHQPGNPGCRSLNTSGREYFWSFMISWNLPLQIREKYSLTVQSLFSDITRFPARDGDHQLTFLTLKDSLDST